MITIIAATLVILIITITMTTNIDAQGVPDGVMDSTSRVMLFIIFKSITITISVDIQGVPDGVMDTYCWLHSTFTLPHLGVVEIDNVNGVDQVFS